MFTDRRRKNRRLQIGDNQFFGFASTQPSTSNNLQSLTPVNYNAEQLWDLKDVYDNNLARAIEAESEASNFSERAYFDQSWEYVERIMASNAVVNTDKAFAVDTEVERPEDFAAI